MDIITAIENYEKSQENSLIEYRNKIYQLLSKYDLQKYYINEENMFFEDKVIKFLNLWGNSTLIVNNDEQRMENNKILEYLKKASEKPYHWTNKKTCSFHNENLIEHLFLTAYVSLGELINKGTKISDKECFKIFITGLLHDVGKPFTIKEKNKEIAYPGHGMIAASSLIHLYNSKFKEYDLEKDDWNNIIQSINLHMSIKDTNIKDDKMVKIKWALLSGQINDNIGKILTVLRIGDYKSSINSYEQKTIETNSEFEEIIVKKDYFEKYLPKIFTQGILISMIGMSGSGKSTTGNKIKKYFDEKKIPCIVIKRDDYIVKNYCLKNKLEITANYSKNFYQKAYNFYKENIYRDRDFINYMIRKDVKEKLENRYVVILDTVMSLFPQISKITYGFTETLRINIPVIRNKLFDDNDNLKTDNIKQQLELFQNRKFGLPFPERINFQQHKALTTNWIMDLENDIQPHIVLPLAYDDIENKVCQNLLERICNFHWNREEFLPPTIEQTEDMDLKELINYLLHKGELKMLKKFFKDNKYLLSFPFKDDQTVFGIKYMEHNKIWKPKWSRECRGVFIKLDCSEHFTNVIILKKLLPRGVEILTKMANTEQSQDYIKGIHDHLDSNQKYIIEQIENNGSLDGYISTKVDGALFGITFYNKKGIRGNIIRNILCRYEIKTELQRNLWDTVKNSDYPYIPIISTNNTLFMGEDMEKYLQRAMNDNSNIDTILSYGYFLKKMEINQDSTLSFEGVCPNRTDINGFVHKELTVSYKSPMFKFIGITYLDDNIFYPHFIFDNFDLPFDQPLYKKINHSNELEEMIDDLDKTAKSNITEEEFLEKHFSEQPGKEIDYEGLVYYQKLNNGTYDYSKCKTPLFYLSHKLKAYEIDKIISLPENVSYLFPTIKKVKDISYQYQERLERFIKVCQSLIGKIIDNTEDDYSKQIIDKLPQKAKNKFEQKTKDVKYKMIINKFEVLQKLSNIFYNELTKIFPLSDYSINWNGFQSWLKKILMESEIYNDDFIINDEKSKEFIKEFFNVVIEDNI